MSDPTRDLLRRLNPNRGARTDAGGRHAAGSMWVTLWTWLAAFAAAVVVLGLVFGYSRNDLTRNPSGEPSTTGSAPRPAPTMPMPSPRLGEAHPSRSTAAPL
jgi:hypothetical protein